LTLHAAPRQSSWRLHVVTGVTAAAIALAACFTLDRPAVLGLDSGGVVFPMTLEAFRAWTAGRLPEWTDRFWGGFPLVGDPTSGALYLPHAIGFLVTPSPHLRAFDVTAALHVGLLAAGTSALLAELGTGAAGATVAAVLTVLSTLALWSAVAFLQLFLALAWWPWCFIAAERLVRPEERPPWRALLLGWVALAAQVLAGYPEFAAYVGVFLCGWILCRRTGLAFRTRVLRLAMLGLGAAALAAPQLLPTLAYLPETGRANTPAAATAVAFEPGMAWAALWPFVDAGPAPLFAGLATLALAVTGAWSRRPGALALLVTAAGGLVLALGDRTPAYGLLHALPVLRQLRIPLKFWTATELALCWLAGIGFDALRRRQDRWRLIAGALVLVALTERATHLARWLPRIADLTATTDVGDVVRRIGRAPLVSPARDAPPAVTLALPKFYGNIPAVADVATITGGSVVLLGRRQGATLATLLHRAQTLSVLGVRWVVTSTPEECLRQLRRLGFLPTVAEADLCVMENPRPIPRYALLYAVDPVATDDEMIARVLHGPMVPTPVMASPAESPPRDASAPPGTVDVVAYRPGRIELRTDDAASRWLLAHDAWSPGWTATIDGAATAIHPAAGMFFALVVPSGQHEVVLRYRAPGLRAGLAIAAIWALAAAIAVTRTRRAPPV
jgi:hypothetical protein